MSDFLQPDQITNGTQWKRRDVVHKTYVFDKNYTYFQQN
jgi:hypothetical protein